MKKVKALTEYLSQKQEAILKTWERKMTESSSQATELFKMSRDKFRDDIPPFLHRFYKSLEGQDISLEDIGKKHGAERWEYGLNLQQIMKEWKLLHQVVMEEINKYEEEQDLEFQTFKRAHKLLAVHIHEGILFSVKEYDHLQQSEIEVQMEDLKAALEKPDQLSHTHNLRRTSHDLKGIMQNIQMGFFLLEDESLSGRAAELVDQMSTSADNLEQLLKDLLDLFRLETHREEVHLSDFDAASLLEELVESMQPMAQAEKLDLQFTGEDSLPVTSDKKKVQRIARNLMLNALKYTGEGHVKVKWGVVSEQKWVLEISDSGPGLAATHAKSLTTKADSSDTVKYKEESSKDGQKTMPEVEPHGEGIGLLIVRHLCKLLDAIIKVDTQLGEGTTFRIAFPRKLSDKQY